MDYPPLSKICFHHPELVIADICTIDRCDDRFLCIECRHQHPVTHSRDLKPLVQILKSDASIELESCQKKYMSMTARINQSFKSLEEQIISSLRRAKTEMLDILDTLVESSQFQTLKDNYKTSFRVFIEDKSLTSKATLKDFIQHHLSIKKVTESTKVMERHLSSILTRIEESFREFQNSISYYTDLTKSKQKNEIPNFVNISKLKFEKSVDAEQRTFPQSIEYLANLDIVVVGDSDGKLSFWNASDMNRILTMSIHDKTVYNLKYEEQRKLLIAGFTNGFIKVMKINPFQLRYSEAAPNTSVKIIKTIRKRIYAVRSLLILPEKCIFLVAGRDPNIEVYSLISYKHQAIIDTKSKGQSGYQMAYIKKKDLVVVGFKEGTISFFNLTTRCELIQIETGFQNWFIDSIRYLKIEDAIIASVSEELVAKWKFSTLDDPKEKREYRVPKGVENMLVFEGEEKVLMGNMGSKLLVLNLKDGTITESEDTQTNECTGVLYLLKYERFIVADWDSRRIAILKNEGQDHSFQCFDPSTCINYVIQVLCFSDRFEQWVGRILLKYFGQTKELLEQVLNERVVQGSNQLKD